MLFFKLNVQNIGITAYFDCVHFLNICHQLVESVHLRFCHMKLTFASFCPYVDEILCFVVQKTRKILLYKSVKFGHLDRLRKQSAAPTCLTWCN